MESLFLPEFNSLWPRLQKLGLTAYEARVYIALLWNSQCKASELATHARVPRQKIYEVLDSLMEKGFARMVREKTKLFIAVEPGLAIPSYLTRRRQEAEAVYREQATLATSLIEDLASACPQGRKGKATLDYLHIVTDPVQSAVIYERMLREARFEYLEFSRPPYAVEVSRNCRMIQAALARGVRCRLLADPASCGSQADALLRECAAAGIEVRRIAQVPLKMALFDVQRGLIALLDPAVARSNWTSIVFEHPGLAQAMKCFFESHWQNSEPLPDARAGASDPSGAA